ncbi:hypothetical protein D3C85_1155460 [compost metagenome]
MHENRRQALDGITAGLVPGFTGRPVALNFLGAERTKTHAAGDTARFATLPIEHGHRRQHFMFTSGKVGEHGQGVSFIQRFAKDTAVENHRCVGTQHDGTRLRFTGAQHSKPGFGLAARKALDIGGRAFVGQGSFVDFGAHHRERYADLGQQFPTARRARGQVERIVHDISLSEPSVGQMAQSPVN